MKDGRKYIDGICGGVDPEICSQIQWSLSEIKNGTVPEFFNMMDPLFYPLVSKFKLS